MKKEIVAKCHKCGNVGTEGRTFYRGYSKERYICKKCQRKYSNDWAEKHREYINTRQSILKDKNISSGLKEILITALMEKHGISTRKNSFGA